MNRNGKLKTENVSVEQAPPRRITWLSPSTGRRGIHVFDDGQNVKYKTFSGACMLISTARSLTASAPLAATADQHLLASELKFYQATITIPELE